MRENEREARYAEAVESVLEVFDTVMNVKAECREVARVVMAVADAEQAELRAQALLTEAEWLDTAHANSAGEGFAEDFRAGFKCAIGWVRFHAGMHPAA